MKQTFISKSKRETIEFARKFAAALKPGSVIALDGDLGSGKTTFIKGLALGLGLKEEDEVKSPTFAIMHLYEADVPLYHFDLYRLESDKEIAAIGFEEILENKNIVICIEWAERAKTFLPPATHRVQFQVTGDEERRIDVL